MTRARGGYIMVEALVVVACMLALMSAIVADQRASMQEMQDRLRTRRAELAARSGIAMAMATLETAETNIVTTQDDWSVQGDGGAAEYDLTDVTFRFQIVDASSLVDMNTATEEQLQLMPLDTGQIDCLLDWREPNLQPRTDGAKDEYYNNLPKPYNTRLGSMKTLDELLLVKYWTANLLYSVPSQTTNNNQPEDADGNRIPLASILTVGSGSPTTTAAGGARINLGQAITNPMALQELNLPPQVAQAIVTRAPFTGFRELLAMPGLGSDDIVKLLNGVVFTNSPRQQGKLNLNTATRAALLTVPGMTTTLADSIVSRQSSTFQELGDLMDISGMDDSLAAQIADYLTIGSDTFIIRAFGQCKGVGVPLELFVRKDSDRVRVVSWQRIPGTTVPTWWQWNTTPYTTTVGTQ